MTELLESEGLSPIDDNKSSNKNKKNKSKKNKKKSNKKKTHKTNNTISIIIINNITFYSK